MNTKERTFVHTVWEYYRTYGRTWLPWRATTDPYRILVSEVMCQQTQVDRVAPKYNTFLEQFPDVASLSRASLGEVLKMWQGLGYNRRAKMLHVCAKEITEQYNGTLPQDAMLLKTLPGVGPYTAGAVMVFAYNTPVPLLETNVRTAYLFHFYKRRSSVTDDELHAMIKKTMDTSSPREWFSALMDYGAHIKRTHGNQNVRSASYTTQTPFIGSDREIRGAILRSLATGQQTKAALIRDLAFPQERLTIQLQRLLTEGMIERCDRRYSLPR